MRQPRFIPGPVKAKMKLLLTSNRFLLGLTAISFASGLAFSICYRDFNWLSRFGALIICWGILLLARPSITKKEIAQHVFAEDSELSLYDPEYYTKKGETIPDWVTDNVLSRRATGLYGPVVCFLGTFTNGFASLLNGASGYAP